MDTESLSVKVGQLKEAAYLAEVRYRKCLADLEQCKLDLEMCRKKADECKSQIAQNKSKSMVDLKLHTKLVSVLARKLKELESIEALHEQVSIFTEQAFLRMKEVQGHAEHLEKELNSRGQVYEFKAN